MCRCNSFPGCVVVLSKAINLPKQIELVLAYDISMASHTICRTRLREHPTAEPGYVMARFLD